MTNDFDASAQSAARTHLGGGWLLAARVAWVVVGGLALVLLVIALPEFYRSAHTISLPELQAAAQLTAKDARLLEEWGISLGAYAAVKTAQIAFFLIVCMVGSALIFWHKSVDRIALFFSLWFAVAGLTTTPLLEPLARAHPMWLLPIGFLQGASLGCLPILTYVFPDGRFVPRWTRAFTLAWIVWIVISPFTPFGIASASGPEPSALWFVVLIPGGMIIGIFAQIYRYLRVSSRVERQQTKWMLFGFSIVALVFVLANLPPLVMPSLLEPGLARVLYLTLGGEFLGIIAFCLWSLFIGIAILRYRLWDIDILIRRTLIYGLLTLTLGLLYVGFILLSQAIIVPRLGRSDFAVVVSTLVTAALLMPLRRRIQNIIDRRFYRRKYDAQQVLTAFALAACDETDLERLTAELARVVDSTMQPEFLGIWLRETGSRNVARND